MNIVIAGLGRYFSGIEDCLQDDVEIVYYFDNGYKYRNQEYRGKKILSHYQIYTDAIDYVVIGIMGFENMKKELLEGGFFNDQIVPFFDNTMDFEQHCDLFVPEKATIYSLKCNNVFLQQKIQEVTRYQSIFFENMIYEIAGSVEKKQLKMPKICSVEETCNRLTQDRVSLSRYGDGEFEIIFGKAKDIYQTDDEKLANRLKEILVSNEDNHIIALADDYGCLSDYRKENQENIRSYMTREKRKMHYDCIDMEKQYYNAYISRPYVIYPHERRKEAEQRFSRLKEIWNEQDLLIIEGELTRMGVGNDLFLNANSLQRIIAPNVNAFSKYDEILDKAKEYGNNKLILIALGPTATVLAYDLAKAGYWALDIGHLDLEYEWFLKGEGYSYIANKYNNEVMGDDEVIPIFDEEYEKSILETIYLD